MRNAYCHFSTKHWSTKTDQLQKLSITTISTISTATHANSTHITTIHTITNTTTTNITITIIFVGPKQSKKKTVFLRVQIEHLSLSNEMQQIGKNLQLWCFRPIFIQLEAHSRKLK